MVWVNLHLKAIEQVWVENEVFYSLSPLSLYLWIELHKFSYIQTNSIGTTPDFYVYNLDSS